MIANSQGNKITPSVVDFTKEGKLIGEGADIQRKLDPPNTIYNVKRFIGRTFDDPAAQGSHPAHPFKVVERNKKEIEMWENLPKEIILHMMSYLRYYDVVVAGFVCQNWHSLSKNELIWKRVLVRHFSLPLPATLRPGAQSWRQEFIRMTNEIPSVLTDLPDYASQMANKAVHVAFANNKNLFSVCYEGLGFKVWRPTNPCTYIFKDNCRKPLKMQSLDAETSQFNSTDEFLLVAGFFPRGADAHILIYKVEVENVFSLVKRIYTNWNVYPCNLWVDETTFLSYHKVWYLPEEDENFEIQLGISVDTNVVVNGGENDGQRIFNEVNCEILGTWNRVGSFKDPESGLPNVLLPIGKASGANFEYNTGIGLLKKGWQDQMKTCTLNDRDVMMGITGFCLSKDKTCFINARPFKTIQEDGETVLYGEEGFKIFKLDLATMTVSGAPLTGHEGIPGTNKYGDEWMENFCPDASADYVACGSETNGAFLWDRHFGCVLKRFSSELDQHYQLPQNVEEEETFVKSVAISRGEQDIMVTVDGYPEMVGYGNKPFNGRIKVYRSKKWIRENN